MQSVWEFLDWVGDVMIGIWAVMSFDIGKQNYSGRVVLAVSTIPLSCGLLKYVCLSEDMGAYVIINLRMAAALRCVPTLSLFQNLII